MKIKFKKMDMLSGVNIALKGVPSKTTMPILECIVIEAKEDIIKLTSNNMELGIETIIIGDITEEGMIAISAKVFSDIIRKLPDNEITIKTDENYQAVITCEKAKFKISGKSGEEFPFLPIVERFNPIIISQFTLKEVIRQTVFSISDNESNKVMTGELFTINEDEFKVVSLDGHRISIRKIKLKEKYESLKVIVPGKTLSEVSKILSGEMNDEVNMFFTEKHIIFEFDNTMVLSRLIEGEYFKIEQMFSDDYETKINIHKKDLIDCIERATLLIKDTDNKPIILNIAETSIELKVNTSMGSMNEDIDIEKEGKDLLIGFNPKFLADALRVIEDETITIYFFNSKAPCFIKDQEETYSYLILPINLVENL